MKSVALSSLERKRKALSVVQFFFFSGIGCLFPFLSNHQKDIGLTAFESAFLNCLTAAAALVAAPISGLVAHKLDKYQTLLVITLLGSGLSFTSLLFVPRVIRSPRHPHIVFDCTNQQLRMESCPNWDGNCNQKPKLPAIGNYSNFSLTKCKYVCSSPNSLLSSSTSSQSSPSPTGGQRQQQQPSSSASNASWYPLHVCFSSASEGNTCMLHDPALADKGMAWTQIQSTSSNAIAGSISAFPPDPPKYDVITFDSRFDRWPVVSLSGESTCIFQSVAPLIMMDHKSYDTIQCRPFVQNCQVHCKVNLLHRPKGGSTISKAPAPCLDVTGDPQVTFYSYLVVRSFADLFLFVAYNLLDGLAITLTNNFDSLYSGSKKVCSIILPLIMFPILTGSLIDYYSQEAGQPDYAPSFILFDGLILITAVLVVAAPAAPLSSSSSASNDSGDSGEYESTTLCCCCPITPAAAASTRNHHRSSANQVPSSSCSGPAAAAGAAATSSSKSGSQSQSSLRSSSASHRQLLLHNRRKHKRKVPIKNWYIFICIVIPLTIWSGINTAILQTHLSPFLMDLGVDQLWLGFGFGMMFITFFPFCLMGKKVVSGIGRLHLVIVGLMFHGLRLACISLLSHPKWMLIPIQCMEAFTLPLMWIGITSYSHHLIRTATFRPSELMIRTGSDASANSNHMRMQYFLNGLHFGVARVIGCGIWMAWITMWDKSAGMSAVTAGAAPGTGSKLWFLSWIAYQDVPDFPEADENGFRILIRLFSLISMGLIALPILFFVHVAGHIVGCFSGVWQEIRQSLVCIQNSCFKCFSMLCCCSCSCKMGKCRLCRRRRQGLQQVTVLQQTDDDDRRDGEEGNGRDSDRRTSRSRTPSQSQPKPANGCINKNNRTTAADYHEAATGGASNAMQSPGQPRVRTMDQSAVVNLLS